MRVVYLSVEFMKNIGQKIEKIRNFRGYSQDYVATRLAITQQHYSKMETGEAKITVQRLEEIAKVLAVSLIDILTYDESKIVFNNSNHDQSTTIQKGVVFESDSANEEIKKLYQSIIADKDKQIELLENHLALYKDMAKNKS